MNSNDYMELLKKNNFQKRIDEIALKYKNKRIVFYGAGEFLEKIIKTYDLSNLNVVGVADLRHTNIEELENAEFFGYKKLKAYTFMEKSPDLILITMLKPEYAEYFFKDELFVKYGKFKFDWFYNFSFPELIKILKITPQSLRKQNTSS